MDATVIIQARMTSSRLPGKVLLPLDGMPLLELMVFRLRRGWPRHIIVATSDHPSDDAIADLCRRIDVACVRGDRLDVLSRYALAARQTDDEHIIRLTADCPLTDPHLYDLAAHVYDGSDFYGWYPVTDGFGFEIVSKDTLMRADREATKPYDREHVMPYVYNNPDLFNIGAIQAPEHYVSAHRVTVDEPADMTMLTALAQVVPVRYVTALEIIRTLDSRPDISRINSHVANTPIE